MNFPIEGLYLLGKYFNPCRRKISSWHFNLGQNLKLKLTELYFIAILKRSLEALRFNHTQGLSVFALIYPLSFKIGFNEFTSLQMMADLNGKIISRKILSYSNVTHKYSRKNYNRGDKQKVVVVKFIYKLDKNKSISPVEDFDYGLAPRVAKCYS